MTMSHLERRDCSGETERVRQRYDRIAPRYDWLIRLPEKLLFGDSRRWVCSQASGDVLEVAIGTGRNLPYYPSSIRLTGVELSPAMLEIANRRAHELGRQVDLRLGDAQMLDFPAASFDTVVFTLALCSIPDDAKAVAEAKRVLRPGGRVLLLEHVRSRIRSVRAIQRAIQPLCLRFEGDHLLREPLVHFKAAGFEVEQLGRFRLDIVERASLRRTHR